MNRLICRLIGHNPRYLFEMVRCCCIPECIATFRQNTGITCQRCDEELS